MRKNDPKKQPPAGLSAEAKEFWLALVEEYEVDDAAGLKLFARVCESLDRLRAAQKFLRKHGEVIPDKKGSVKAHPACAIEKEAHRQMLEALKMMNLDLEPLRSAPGRPGGS